MANDYLGQYQNRDPFSYDFNADADYEAVKSKVLGELKEVFRPELINRIDEIIVFHKLTGEDIKKISAIMLKSLKARMEALGHDITFTDALIEHLSEAGYDEVYGARPLRRAIQSKVEDFLADSILSGAKFFIDFNKPQEEKGSEKE